MKQVLLPILATALFIVGLGLFLRKTDSFPIASPKPETSSKIKIAEIVVEVEVADSNDERAKGLSGKDKLEDAKGMLFVFDQNDIRPSFWMRGMKFPIDIIWIKDNKITQIDKNVEPQPETTDEKLTRFKPNTPVDYVLEVNAGFSDKNNLQVGANFEIINE